MTKRAILLLLVAVPAAFSLSVSAQESPARPAPPAPVVAAAPPAAVAPEAVIAAHAAPVLAAVAPAAPAMLAPAPAAPLAVRAMPAVAPLPPLPRQQGVSVFYIGDNYLGINAEEITRENMGRYGLSGEPRGVGVREVVKDSPAERAGLKTNDVILRFDGETVTSIRKLNRLIDESAPEHTARLTVRRGGSEQEITVTLGKRGLGNFSGVLMGDEFRRSGELLRGQLGKQGEEFRRQMDLLRREGQGAFALFPGRGRRIGVTTNTLGKQLADYFGVTHGVLITNVEPDSPAARAGLKAGDIVTEADGEKIEDAGDLSRSLNRKEEGEVTLSVVRDRNRRTVKVTPEKGKMPGGVWQVSPGSIVIDAPSVAVTAPRIKLDLPRITVTPRPKITARPKIVTTERML